MQRLTTEVCGWPMVAWRNPGPRPSVVCVHGAGVRRVISAFSESLRDRIEDKLPHVTVPTLVVRGAKDVLVPQEWAEEVTRLLPVGRLVVAPQAGHMVPYRRPDLLADLVGEFLARELLAIDADAGTQVGKRRSVE